MHASPQDWQVLQGGSRRHLLYLLSGRWIPGRLCLCLVQPWLLQRSGCRVWSECLCSVLLGSSLRAGFLGPGVEPGFAFGRPRELRSVPRRCVCPPRPGCHQGMSVWTPPHTCPPKCGDPKILAPLQEKTICRAQTRWLEAWAPHERGSRVRLLRGQGGVAVAPSNRSGVLRMRRWDFSTRHA